MVDATGESYNHIGSKEPLQAGIVHGNGSFESSGRLSMIIPRSGDDYSEDPEIFLKRRTVSSIFESFGILFSCFFPS